MIMMKPKVSIIVPIYNVENYLDRCMQSLICQTLTDIEIILVDDESPDKCPQMCEAYAIKDNRIKVIHKKNGGLGFARNSGLDVATGEYVAFVDSDDFIDIRMYNKLYEIAHKEDLDIVYCGFYEYNNINDIKKRQEVNKYTVFLGDKCHEVLHGMLSPCGSKGRITKFEMSVWHSIYRRSLFVDNNIKFCSERQFISEDIIFHIDYIWHCKKIAFIPEPYYYYCLNETSLSKKYRKDRLQKVDILCTEVYNRVSAKQYKFSIDDCMYFACLSLRYPLTMLKQYNMSSKERKEKIEEMLSEGIFEKWMKKIDFSKLPYRYQLFFFTIKMRWIKILNLLIMR